MFSHISTVTEIAPDTLASYQQEVLRKMKQVQDLLEVSRSFNRASVVDSLEIQDALVVLGYFQCADHIDEIIPYVHDLWSAKAFAQGFRYGSTFKQKTKRNELLKPYEAFTQQERAFEELVCLGDMRVLYETLQTCPGIRGRPTVTKTMRDLFGQINPLAASMTFCFLARDDQFLERVAPAIHENWRKALQVGLLRHGVQRREISFQELSQEGRAVLVRNIQVDILALALFLSNGH